MMLHFQMACDYIPMPTTSNKSTPEAFSVLLYSQTSGQNEFNPCHAPRTLTQAQESFWWFEGFLPSFLHCFSCVPTPGLSPAEPSEGRKALEVVERWKEPTCSSLHGNLSHVWRPELGAQETLSNQIKFANLFLIMDGIFYSWSKVLFCS